MLLPIAKRFIEVNHSIIRSFNHSIIQSLYLPPRIRFYLLLLALALYPAGLLFSPVLLSISMIGLALFAVCDFRPLVNPRWRQSFITALRHPLTWAVALPLVITFLGGWQTVDWSYWLERLRIKAPLLAVPLIWGGLPPQWRGYRLHLLALLVVFLVLTCFAVGINYAFHATEINELIKQGRSIPVPRNHIRFSLLVAIGSLTAGYLAYRSFLHLPRLWTGCALFLFLFLHLLAVRSGLFCAYGAWLAVGVVHAIRSRRWRPALIGLALILAIPTLAYLTVPSLRAKINYARYEMWRSAQGLDSSDYSDAGRLTSIRLGLQLFQESPLLGIGPGNLRLRMDQLYAAHYPNAPAIRPHNQFVSILAGSGLVGLALFLASLTLILFHGGAWRNPLFLGFFIVMVLSFLVENTLENSMGVGIWLLGLFYFRPLGKE